MQLCCHVESVLKDLLDYFTCRHAQFPPFPPLPLPSWAVLAQLGPRAAWKSSIPVVAPVPDGRRPAQAMLNLKASHAKSDFEGQFMHSRGSAFARCLQPGGEGGRSNEGAASMQQPAPTDNAHRMLKQMPDAGMVFKVATELGVRQEVVDAALIRFHDIMGPHSKLQP